MAIMRCEGCSSISQAAQYQDRVYGFKNRVMNAMKRLPNTPWIYRCTICLKELVKGENMEEWRIG